MFLPKAASDFQDKMDQFKKAAEGFKGQVGELSELRHARDEPVSKFSVQWQSNVIDVHSVYITHIPF